eukprot:scaffold4833_cov233-Amphora_coffeaeformis.AAC.34
MTMPITQTQNQALTDLRDVTKPSLIHTKGLRKDPIGLETGELEDWQNVTVIRENDVLLGRGSRSNQPGNVKFRQHIASNRYRYLAASKIEKPKIAEDVVRMWRELNPPGRFLSRKDEDEVEGNSEKKDDHAVWYDVGDKKARLKTSMALRERTPDAVQYLQIIRQKEVEETQRSTNYVKQQLGMHDPYSGHQYPGEPMPHHPQSFGEVSTTHPMHANSRRASFAGFVQRHVDAGMHRPYCNHEPSGHSRPMPGAPSAGPPRRSSLMGERQAQLYMMQQQVEAQRRRIEMEMEMEDHSERLETPSGFQMPMPRPSMAGHLPPIPDQRESSHSNEDPVLGQVYPPKPVRTITNESLPRDAPSIVSADSSMFARSQSRMVQKGELRAPKIGKAEYFFDGMRSSKVEAFEDTEDTIVVEHYRSLLQGWADRESQATGGDPTDMDEDMESVRAPRRRGVDRTVSGCSVQSTLSELMAMSIITSGTDDDFFGMDKSVSSEIVLYDDF